MIAYNLSRMTNTPDPNSSYSPWRLSGMGMELLSAILAGAFFGWLFDRWQGTRPTGLIVGIILGLIVGMTEFMRKAIRASRDAAADYEARHHRSEDDK
ncbi:MAG: AtpZ/AtpI family protein [Planctomycetota bacterium]